TQLSPQPFSGGAMRTSSTLILLCLSSTFAFAQSERGNITGLITDPTGALVAGAQLSMFHRDTNAVTRATTTSAGDYNAPNLLPGVYRVEIGASGFKRKVQQKVVLSASGTCVSTFSCKLARGPSQ